MIKHTLFSTLAAGALLCSSTVSTAQSMDATPPQDWFHMDEMKDGYRGVGTHKLYSDLLKGKKSKAVIVAVIDSGVDWEHEDLDDVMWVNPDEIPGNGIDDDKNGYIDDIHGWNFIAGPGGNVNQDNLEITRLYRKYDAKFKNVNNPTSLSGSERDMYTKYLKIRKDVQKAKDNAMSQAKHYTEVRDGALERISKIESLLGKKPLTVANLDAISAGADEDLAKTIDNLKGGLADDPKMTIKSVKEDVNAQLNGAIDYYSGQANHYYNTDFDPRHLVGDDYSNPLEKSYGTNDYEGPDAGHGTHVAGIIGAERNNGIGMDGVADNVRIMTIRAVPDGDERDKDVANAIRYAVDNGASIINMSFGKGYSWNKGVVDAAVAYAAAHDVLLVHAAGNSSQDNDVASNFPNDKFEKAGLFKPKKSKTWLEVGALNYKKGEDTPATFSNYGEKNVDIFAPGVKIYSTIPDNEYASFQGTSMASPVVAGVAAILRSYYPELTAKQVKSILMKTSVPVDDKVKVPGSEMMMPFKDLSVSGGVVNAYKAVIEAEKTKGKKKGNAWDVDRKHLNPATSVRTGQPRA